MEKFERKAGDHCKKLGLSMLPVLLQTTIKTFRCASICKACMPESTRAFLSKDFHNKFFRIGSGSRVSHADFDFGIFFTVLAC